MKVLMFKVKINGLKNKMWRVIEVTDKMTIGDLAYSILASFNSLAYHLYSITYKDRKYKCYIDDDLIFDDEIVLDASQSILRDIGLNDNDTMEMEYDFRSTTTFKIKYLGFRELEKNDKTYYRSIIDGAGNGMLDDVGDSWLEDIVKDTDKLGYSKYPYNMGYETNKMYDYREFDLKKNNIMVKKVYPLIKKGYENIE